MARRIELTRSGAPHAFVARGGVHSLLNTLIERPDIARTVRALPLQTFAALVRKIGVEDAGEIVALATTEQLVQAFDEDLFVSDRAGERETFNVGRFVSWLEVLLEAGDKAAADRFAELDEDFVAHALSGVVLVLDEEALRERLDEGDASRQVDKGIESALSEELEGYILIAKQHDGWDATLALILALDRDHRALLVRLLDRLAHASSRYLDDLEELGTVLSEGESLAEDVEGAREERRAKQGYVEPQAARAFLKLARTPCRANESPEERDPLTRAYFRELERDRIAPVSARANTTQETLRALPPAARRELEEVASGADVFKEVSARRATMRSFVDGLRDLSRDKPRAFAERMEEFAYLTNVLLSGHERDGVRLRPKEAAEAVLATACYGAVLELRGRHKRKREKPATSTEMAEVLRERAVDFLFRVASCALVGARKAKGPKTDGLLYSAEELESHADKLHGCA